MYREFDGILLDYSRQRANLDTLNKLFNLAEVCLFPYSNLFQVLRKLYNLAFSCFVMMQAARVKEKINRMFNGEHVRMLLMVKNSFG